MHQDPWFDPGRRHNTFIYLFIVFSDCLFVSNKIKQNLWNTFRKCACPAIPRWRPWVAGLFRTAGLGRSSGLLPDWSLLCASPSSPPGFPGMTFSLGNHFLRASTAIFNFNSFMKSCFAHLLTSTDTFELKAASPALCACCFQRQAQSRAERHRSRLPSEIK